MSLKTTQKQMTRLRPKSGIVYFRIFGFDVSHLYSYLRFVLIFYAFLRHIYVYCALAKALVFTKWYMILKKNKFIVFEIDQNHIEPVQSKAHLAVPKVSSFRVSYFSLKEV